MAQEVDHPTHYTSHPSGVECIEITQHMGFCLGNAVKYLWRTGLKGPPVRDLQKARWYILRHIDNLIEEPRKYHDYFDAVCRYVAYVGQDDPVAMIITSYHDDNVLREVVGWIDREILKEE